MDFYTNSIGMEMLKIEPGSFIMGDEPDVFWDEQPLHKVTISRPFFMSRTQVTVDQFRRFRKDRSFPEDGPTYATGVSWYEASAFCAWLGAKEGRTYRLPTEAEWEYVCKKAHAGASEGSDATVKVRPPDKHFPENMLSEVREWCLDWYGEYPATGQTDPSGPETGFAKVIRGIGLESKRKGMDTFYDRPGYSRPDYTRPSKRSGIAPGFGHYAEDGHNPFGNHEIGFRVVEAAPIETNMAAEVQASHVPYIRRGIKQRNEMVRQGPDSGKPYFRRRFLLPVPLDNSDREAIDAAGLHPSFRRHNHSPALEVCSNGDVLYITYTSYFEYEPEVSLIGSRLRFGADSWDMPEPLFDFPNVNNHAPLLWNDSGTLHLFWGNPRLKNAFPFQWTSSTDNGATWSEVKFPFFINNVGEHSRQPINSAFRDCLGRMYVASDAEGPQSVLWASDDNGHTWFDTGGRTHGRHTTCALLKDGRILGMGGKKSDIDGYMPKSFSADGGKTWLAEKTIFPRLPNGHRPTLIRLASGRLFFAGDSLETGGGEKISFVALSDDEGETWKIKKLAGAQVSEGRDPEDPEAMTTIGYSVARQAPNGLIHLITSQNHPCLHFEMNEAWILDEQAAEKSEVELTKSSARSIGEIKRYEERYPDGGLRISYEGGIADDGRFLLHGTERWYYENGTIQREATYTLGRKTGTETFLAKDGGKIWAWEYDKEGKDIWTRWWPDGGKKSRTTWKHFHAEGPAVLWDRSGAEISNKEFRKGTLI